MTRAARSRASVSLIPGSGSLAGVRTWLVVSVLASKEAQRRRMQESSKLKVYKWRSDFSTFDFELFRPSWSLPL